MGYKKFKKYFLSVIFFASLPLFVKAQIVKNQNPNDISELLVIVINIANWILGISAAAALLAFVIGGLMMILSGGNKNTVEQGKATLIGATIGLIVVFTSFLVINFAMQTLGYNQGVFGKWDTVKSF